jgi:hypothetical protein
MVEGEVATSPDLALEDGRALIEAQPASARIEFFGGEPTIYPHFVELLTLARQRGHSCSVASNGRAFAAAEYTARIAALGAEDIYVRTSLYGADEATHDYYTRATGSYRQTLQGIRNLVAAGFRTQVNIVVLPRNVETLTQAVDLVAGLGAQRIKFGMVVLSPGCLEHAVSLAALRPALRSACARAVEAGRDLNLEKMPLCAAPERIAGFFTERQIAPMSRAYALNGACGRCLLQPWCPGLDPLYAEHLGLDNLEPFDRVPADQVLALSPGEMASYQPEIFRLHLVALDPAWLEDGAALQALADLKERIGASLGELALIPQGLIAPICSFADGRSAAHGCAGSVAPLTSVPSPS